MSRAFAEVGYAGIGDQNAVFTDGHFPMTLSNGRGQPVAVLTMDRALIGLTCPGG